MGKLMVNLMRFLPLCALISIVLSGITAQPAHAKLGPISIRSVYTTDENFTSKTVFAPGDRINYHVDVDNTTGSTFPIDVRFQAFANDYSPDPRLYHYDQTEHVDQMPVGLSRFYSPVTLPSDAVTYFYAVRITITPSGCSGTNCRDDGDWAENTFTIRMLREPVGKAPNLVVLVHGCCTDGNDVKNDWDSFGRLITGKIPTAGTWEIVVWDWTKCTSDPNVECTPQPPIWDAQNFFNQANTAYTYATIEGQKLANIIENFPTTYDYIHFIGHSAGAKLIHEAATWVAWYKVTKNEKRPFIHITFLDAFTKNDTDTNSYGALANYPNHYSEHYVDRTFSPIGPWTNSLLLNAYNFDVTGWHNANKGNNIADITTGHQWPRYWYEQSVISHWHDLYGYRYGYPLSLEGGNDQYNQLSTVHPPNGCKRLIAPDTEDFSPC
jgi:hypothetical protein